MTGTAHQEGQLEASWRRFCERPDEASFAPLYAGSKAIVYSLSLRILRSEEDALDAFQATYCRLLQVAGSGGSAEREGRFRLLIYRLVLREARNLKARRARRQTRELAMDTKEEMAPVEDNPARSAGEEEMRRIVESMLARLPDPQNEVMALHLFNELSQAEIARMLGVSRMTVSRRVEQARRRLEIMLRQAGLAHPARGAALPLGVAAWLRNPPETLSAHTIFSYALLHQPGSLPALTAEPASRLVHGIVGAMIGLALLIAVLFLMPQTDPTRVTVRGGPFDGWIGRKLAGEAMPVDLNPALGINTTARGVNMAEWASPYAFIEFEPDSFYRFRMRVASDRPAPGHSPLWFAVVDNYSPELRRGTGGFSVKYEWLDYMGSANGPRLAGGEGREFFEAWVLPPATLTPAWNDRAAGFYARANAPNRGARFRFGVLDSDRAGIFAEEDEGMLTLGELQVEQYRWEDLRRDELLYDSARASGRDSGLAVEAVSQISVMHGENWIRIVPTDETGYYDSLAVIAPGTHPLDFTSTANLADHYPLAWEADQLYIVEAELEAGRDLMDDGRMMEFRFGMDTPTQEVAAISLMSDGIGGLSLPQPGAPRTFVGLFYSHTPSATDAPHMRRLRPRVDFLWRARADGTVRDGSQSWISIHGLRVFKATVDSSDGKTIHPL